MEGLINDNYNNLENMVIRVSAALSSFANPIKNSLIPDDPDYEYEQQLIKEKELLIRLSEKAKLIKVIISPFASFIIGGTSISKDRLNRLKSFLDINYTPKYEFAISEYISTNLLFFGENMLFEGHSRIREKDFAWTITYSDKDNIENRIKIFDYNFNEFCKKTIDKYGSKGDDPNNPEHLRKAAINAVNKAIEELNK